MYKHKIEKALNAELCLDVLAPQLWEAMRYSVLGGGKRIRASLLLEFNRVCGGDVEHAIPFACAVEMVHAASLIHDDLPCMDDDDLRRGKPSCHVQFNEATALLAGDALLALSFDTMTNAKFVSCDKVVKAVNCLSKAWGAHGMTSGQVMDMENETCEKIGEHRLQLTTALKTGSLISAACEMGCILANADEKMISAARSYASRIGMAFQITDDILDATGTTEELGKPAGSDQRNTKATYVTIYGIEKSKRLAATLIHEAKEVLISYNINSEYLFELADGILNRTK